MKTKVAEILSTLTQNLPEMAFLLFSIRLTLLGASIGDALAKAYNMKNKRLYKQCLISLELDLIEYRARLKAEHPANVDIIKLYERLWNL